MDKSNGNLEVNVSEGIRSISEYCIDAVEAGICMYILIMENFRKNVLRDHTL